MHRLDPRVKVISTLATILALGLTPEGIWAAFGVFFLLVIGLAWGARLEPFFTLRRSVLALPFMLAALAVPFTLPGRVVWTVPLVGWSVYEPGLIRFFSILARSWLAVQVAILLTATTRFPDVLWAFGALRFPRTLVSTIAFMYRYLFVLADEALRMVRARAARSPKQAGRPGPGLLWQGRTAGTMIGSLFLRALERSERVYAAMLARGYDGRMQTSLQFHMRREDWSALILLGSALAITLWLAFGW